MQAGVKAYFDFFLVPEIFWTSEHAILTNIQVKKGQTLENPEITMNHIQFYGQSGLESLE